MARTLGSSGPVTETRIKEVAVRLISRYGFESMTLRQLAEAAGLQSGSIYRYYSSKQDLLASLLVEHMQGLLQEWEAVMPCTEDPLTLLEAFCDFHVKAHTERQHDVFIGNMELRSLEPAHFETVVGLRKRYESILSTILSRGVNARAFTLDDPQIATYIVLAMLTGVCNWYRREGHIPQDEIIRIHTRMALRAVLAQPPVESGP
ncbi:MAG: TetR/AcrR family transcriptional regulator [Comamonadaceae bacterium]|nr:MAG: TetR/AcrR family transcriptional regulator [Comamonadaceae bacterium]